MPHCLTAQGPRNPGRARVLMLCVGYRLRAADVALACGVALAEVERWRGGGHPAGITAGRRLRSLLDVVVALDEELDGPELADLLRVDQPAFAGLSVLAMVRRRRAGEVVEALAAGRLAVSY